MLLPALAHAAFSPLGFNPTDEGFILAASRRLLEGEIPHRDFIAIRPAGSALLHAPEVWLGGPATFWISRLVAWCEFGVIAWAWVCLAHRMRKERPPAPASAAVLAVAFVLSSHTFPPMAWHTVDGLLAASLGLVLASGAGGASRLWGYVLIGAAMLFKQNFVALVPAALLILGDARRPAAWLAAAAPALLYVCVLGIAGALPAAAAQLGAETDLIRSGVLAYVFNPWMYGGLALGFLAAELSLRPARGERLSEKPIGSRKGTSTIRAAGSHRPGSGVAAILGMAAACVALLAAGVTMDRDDTFFLGAASYLIFGAAFGATASELRLRGLRDRGVRFGALALATAWTASISVGYASPALATGALAVSLLAAVGAPFHSAAPRGPHARQALLLTIILACLVVPVWVHARLARPYHDLPARQLTRRLDPVLLGGRFLRTSENTLALMADLERAVAETGGRRYAILTDFPGWWATSRQRNPLSCDWPQSIELGRPELKRRVLTDLDRMRGRGGRVIAQKVYAFQVASGFLPIGPGDSWYFAVHHVRRTFRKVGETAWFEIYE